MKNYKTIKIITIILIPFLIFFTYFYISKNKQKQTNTDITTNSETDRLTSSNKNGFNTNTENIGTDTVYISTSTKYTDNITEDKSTTIENTSQINTENLSDSKADTTKYIKGPDDIKSDQVKKILLDWEITKDIKLLEKALILSEPTDNETILEAWKLFMQKNSSELVKIINSSNNIKQTKLNIFLIFEWYIELSGEYETLTNSKKQELTKQYNQLK